MHHIVHEQMRCNNILFKFFPPSMHQILEFWIERGLNKVAGGWGEGEMQARRCRRR